MMMTVDRRSSKCARASLSLLFLVASSEALVVPYVNLPRRPALTHATHLGSPKVRRARTATATTPGGQVRATNTGAAAVGEATPLVGKVYACALVFAVRVLLLDARSDVRVKCQGADNYSLIRGRIESFTVDIGGARGALLQLTGRSFLRVDGRGNLGLRPLLLLAAPWLFLMGFPLPRILLLPALVCLVVGNGSWNPLAGEGDWACRYRGHLSAADLEMSKGLRPLLQPVSTHAPSRASISSDHTHADPPLGGWDRSLRP